ncbi:hypothetical protein BVRB_9g212450 isoform B [Beta vulgaris subsp. vulgaris]|nr:hypothetical protein BVRB_9g212450 isoform B [Beta vulgaris subsp. vulgaris]
MEVCLDLCNQMLILLSRFWTYFCIHLVIELIDWSVNVLQFGDTSASICPSLMVCLRVWDVGAIEELSGFVRR